jgi:hypothetical protein
MGEYRISTHNYSAEYGRTSGGIANAVSQSGTDNWHGLFYSYFKNEKLNANGFQENRLGFDRAPLRELEAGGAVTGSVWHKLFLSLPFDWLRYRSRADPVEWLVPTREFIDAIPANTDAGKLLRQYAGTVVPSAPGQQAAKIRIAPSVTIDRYSGVPRLDYARGAEGRYRFTGRLALSQLRQPDLFFSPYPGFSAPFRQGAMSLSFGLTAVLRPWLTDEFRVALGDDSTRLDRVHNEVPFLSTPEGIALPGSSAAFTFHNSGRNFEISDSLGAVSGRNAWKFGGGLLHRRITSVMTVLSGGQYEFLNLDRFAAGEPESLLLTFDRSHPSDFLKPPFDGEYAYNQFFLFAQHNRQLSRRLFVNYGFRYEYFGEPNVVGPTQAYEAQLGRGSTLQEMLSQATWGFQSGRLYSSRTGEPALRAGWAYDISGNGNTLLRGSYGWFYDRPFDNLWQNLQVNRLLFGFSNFGNINPSSHTTVHFLDSPSSIAGKVTPDSFDDPLPPVLYQANIRSARAQNFFLGLQQRIPEAGILELAYAGSVVSGLLTTDKVNRPFSVGTSLANPLGLLNSGLPLLSYRANQGKSNFHALTATFRFQSGRLRGQAAYTWSHSIDLESDPLAGEFLNFNFFNQQQTADTRIASFTRQFDSQADRASSDFDQRHNFVLYGVADLPTIFPSSRAHSLFRNWQVAAMAAVRSGFPYTVFANQVGDVAETVESLYNNPANVLNPSAARTDIPAPLSGGRVLLQQSAFQNPASGKVGNAGRNSFEGPGVFSLDVSLARPFRVQRWERARITLRCDAYNVLNHVNLNNPSRTYLFAQEFGVATFGRREVNAGFPLLTPFNETARVVQVLLRLQF